MADLTYNLLQLKKPHHYGIVVAMCNFAYSQCLTK